MTDEIPKHYLPTFTQDTDCSAAFDKELLHHLQSDVVKSHCHQAAPVAESMKYTQEPDGSIEIEPFIAVRLSQSEGEPARIGLHGLIEESRDTRVDENHKQGFITFPEGLEGEGHVGVMIRY
jgi:hypothetical protein